MVSGNEIRAKYLEFFKNKSHKIYESASLIPDDPTMLLTIAGMVPFKPFFMGKKEPVYKRAASSQKCMRTNDLENVGRTARHHTFFEMLGNFSFGDYFKEEAIEWAWEFITKELKLPKERLWVSVFEKDDESVKIWNKKIGISLDRIVKLGEKDNFWTAGPTGSCGPCSEIYVDLGEKFGCNKPTCGVGCNCDRYLEIWNLVFTEYNKLEDGSLIPLPKKNIDTGMGLERITAVMQNVESNFETDLLFPILEETAKLTGHTYKEDKNADFSLRVISDHIRAVSFMIGDGVLPSNDGRGYVLRRILRRAARHGRLLKYNKPFLYKLVDKVVEIMGSYYSEIKENKEHIKTVILREEEKFEATLDQGINIANEEIKKLKSENKEKMDAEVVFKLYGTYGFPYELTEEICDENNIVVIYEEFKEKMEEEKERARNSREVIKEKIEDSFIEEFFVKNGKTIFEGYEKLEIEAEVYFVEEIEENIYEVIFNKTVFYAESGGQASDFGMVYNVEFKGNILNVNKKKDIYIHRIKSEAGEIKKGDILSLKVDGYRRAEIKRNHTATHLLHAALREVIGNHVQQAGSMVTDDRLRFDFTHYEALKPIEIEEIERIVNKKIFENIEVNKEIMDIDKAKEKGAMALFGDKYGDVVRVIEVPGYSIELCGGTHVDRTGEIGLFKIISEAGIAAGTRRLEAVTGFTSFEYTAEIAKNLAKVMEILKTDYDHVVEKSEKLMENIKEIQKENDSLKSKLASMESDKFLSNPEIINGINVIIKDFKDKDADFLRTVVDKAKDKLNSCIVVLGSENENALFVVGVTKDLVQKGFKAGDIVKEAAKIAGGNGGGRPDFAQAGGKQGDKVKEALKHIEKMLRENI